MLLYLDCVLSELNPVRCTEVMQVYIFDLGLEIYFPKEMWRYFINSLQLNIEKEGSNLLIACDLSRFPWRVTGDKSEAFRERLFPGNILRNYSAAVSTVLYVLWRHICIYITFFFLLAAPWSLQDWIPHPSWTHVLSSESAESWPLDHQKNSYRESKGSLHCHSVYKE